MNSQVSKVNTHQPSRLIGSGKRPKIQPLTVNDEHEVGVSKYQHNGKINHLSDKHINLLGFYEATPEQEQLLIDAMVLL